MPSNASKGAYYKTKTRRWLADLGYEVVDMEIVRQIRIPGKPTFAVKRDQLGSDLMAVNATRIIFVQVKGGEQCVGTGQFLAAQREFDKYQFPRFVTRVIAAWAPGARRPRVILVPHPIGESNGQESSRPGTEEKGTPRRQEVRVEVRTSRPRAGHQARPEARPAVRS